MNTGNRVFAIICLGISLWLMLESLQYKYMVKYTPGPGFMPFWIGVVLAIFSLALLLETVKKQGSQKRDLRCLPARHSLYRLGWIMLITAGLTLVMSYLGFTLSVILFVPIILYFLEEVHLIRSVITGILFGAGVFLVFRYWLDLNLPTGLLGF